ncbi:hypothetical protein [Egbenema bharatensis]|uniref:hypothetical protein n=1 Tax=Egbenema bharatensis TaxID=3463334 RepID=UPI003A85EC3B
MKSRNTRHALLFGAMLTATTACVSLQNGKLYPPISSTEPIVSNPGQSNGSSPHGGRARSSRKIVTVNLEGQATQMELQLFQQDALPFTTYYPVSGFTPEVAQSESHQSTIAQFYFSPTGTKDDEAYVKVFFPHRSVSLEAIQDLVLGEQGLLVNNQWELVDRTNIVSYPWATEKLIYQHRDQNSEMSVGSIYIGQEGDYTFYVVTHYPIEYGDGFEPRSSIVLENLQFAD